MSFTVPQNKDERVVTKFALLPVTIRRPGGYRETRWLETVNVHQTYESDWTGGGWVNTGFID